MDSAVQTELRVAPYIQTELRLNLYFFIIWLTSTSTHTRYVRTGHSMAILVVRTSTPYRKLGSIRQLFAFYRRYYLYTCQYYLLASTRTNLLYWLTCTSTEYCTVQYGGGYGYWLTCTSTCTVFTGKVNTIDRLQVATVCLTGSRPTTDST